MAPRAEGAALPEMRELLKRGAFSIGETESVPLPRTAQGFGRYLSTHKRVIELEIGLQIIEIRHGGGVRAVTLKRRQP